MSLILQSIDESIDYMVAHQCSVARFGAGEMTLIEHRGIGFQAYDEALAKRLEEILKSKDDPALMICVPNVFCEAEKLTGEARVFWIQYLGDACLTWAKYMNQERWYGNTQMVRFYMDYQDKTKSTERFEKWKNSWEGRDVLIIEGEKSRFGVRNDLLGKVRSIQRILAPTYNAYTKYKELLKAASQWGRGKLVLIALGPTATVLAHDLHQLGIQAIDVGYLDIEYEWYLKKATKKIPVFNKYINEVTPHHVHIVDIDWAYNQQIIKKIQR